MKLTWWISGMVLLLLFAAACSSTAENVDGDTSPQPEGPALIMFYTDN